MLSLDQLTLTLGTEEDSPRLLSQISATFKRGEFIAVIGPSGCGKSTLLKMIAGIATGEEEGTIHWDGRNLADEDFNPSEFGYVPQFSIAYEDLTVGECVEYSARLRVSGLSREERDKMVARLLGEVGMGEFQDRPVKVLSGGQKRRLALAMELVSSPPILLCDEVTSGLDPRSEDEIVNLLRNVARDGNRLVISVTHSLKHLHSYDAVVVLYKGVLAYAGRPDHLAHYFRVEDPSLIYAQLESRDPEGWQASWLKHSASFLHGPQEEESEKDRTPVIREVVSSVCPECRLDYPIGAMYCKECGAKLRTTEDGREKAKGKGNSKGKEITAADSADDSHPGALSQLVTLVERRLLIFLRSKAQLWLQAGMVFGFPCLVACFGWNGLPQIRNLGMGLDLNVIQQLTEARDFLAQASKVGSLVSGIVMFEVILLTLMGANNSGREIASERQLFEKEKLSGLSPAAYIGSKILFLGLLSAIQSLWMGLFVHYTCAFPGDLSSQLLFLFLVNAAMTSICLAISSYMKTAEQASMASIYLVGFQLPLSGAVLALPSWLGLIAQPFIAAYWSWSGILQSLRGERYYDIVVMVIQTSLSLAPLCILVLGIHIGVGILLAYQGCLKTRME
ncbi:MAG: ATP-binding cassette domain-containing protein [Verrucomicrobia bacterium]|nr:ATP-binding cassette domain-containing protein [Verrucomicrobiota bacterium]